MNPCSVVLVVVVVKKRRLNRVRVKGADAQPEDIFVLRKGALWH